jgi:hypothetical protein
VNGRTRLVQIDAGHANVVLAGVWRAVQFGKVWHYAAFSVFAATHHTRPSPSVS